MSLLAALLPSSNSSSRSRALRGADLREVCAKVTRAEFEAAYPNAWLVTGLPNEDDMPSFRTAVAGAATGASGLLGALTLNADKVELHPVRALETGETRLTVGRASSSDVVLRHASISKAHAVLSHRAGVWSVADVGSTNGTFANFRPVVPKAPAMALADRAMLRFGSVGCALMLNSGDVWAALAPSGAR